MTVLIAWPDLFPVTHAGSVRGMAFTKAATELGLSPIIVTPKVSSSTSETTERTDAITIPLYDSYAERLPPPFPVLLLPFTIARLRTVAVKGRVRAIVSSTPGLFLPLESLLVAKLCGAPFFLDVRDSWALEEKSHTGALRNRIKLWLEGILCRRASKIWTVTESLAELIAESHGLSSERVQVVPNGADLSVFHPSDNEKKYDLIFLGAPSSYEDPGRALEAFLGLSSARPALRVLWLGWERGVLDDSAIRILEHLVSSGILELRSRVLNSEVPSLLAQARVGVVSLCGEDVYRTAIGAKVYEYLASGLPLACLGPPGASEVRRLVDSCGVGFYATSPERFALLAAEILAKPEKLEGLRKRCVDVSKRFDRREICQQALQDFVVPYLKQGTGA